MRGEKRMKKYSKPEISINVFKEEDIIMVSGTLSSKNSTPGTLSVFEKLNLKY